MQYQDDNDEYPQRNEDPIYLIPRTGHPSLAANNSLLTPTTPHQRHHNVHDHRSDPFSLGQPPYQQPHFSHPGPHIPEGSPSTLWRTPDSYSQHPHPHFTHPFFDQADANVAAPDALSSSPPHLDHLDSRKYHNSKENPGSAYFAFVPIEQVQNATTPFASPLDQTGSLLPRNALDAPDPSAGQPQIPAYTGTGDWVTVDAQYGGPPPTTPGHQDSAVTPNAFTPGSELPSNTQDVALTGLGSHLPPICRCCQQPHPLCAAGFSLQPFNADVEPIVPDHEQDIERSAKRRKRDHDPPLPFSSQEVGASSQQPGCVKCRMHHKHCAKYADDEACTRCLKKAVFRCLCSRDRLSEITLYRTGAGTVKARKFKGPRNFLDHLIRNASNGNRSSSTTTIKLRQDYGTSMNLDVCPIVVSDELYNDMPEENRHFYKHRYQVANISNATATVIDFVKRSAKRCIDYHVHGMDFLTRDIFRCAGRMASEGFSDTNTPFLAQVLWFWTAGRLIEEGWSFAGNHTLGLENGAKLISAPVIDEQLAVILVDQVLDPFRKKVVKDLDAIITHQRRARWLELVLAVFILLNHYHMAMQHQWKFSRDHGSRERYTSKEFVTKLHAGARCLLTHFHVVCGGRKPFEKTWSDSDPKPKPSVELKNKKLADLKEDEDEFVAKLIDEIAAKMPEFEQLTNTEEYEAEHWFTGQMFVDHWRPLDPPAHNDMPVKA